MKKKLLASNPSMSDSDNVNQESGDERESDDEHQESDSEHQEYGRGYFDD